MEDYFTKLIQRVAPKHDAQARAEVVVTRRFLENFSGDQARHPGSNALPHAALHCREGLVRAEQLEQSSIIPFLTLRRRSSFVPPCVCCARQGVVMLT